jgi:hypothetical protein
MPFAEVVTAQNDYVLGGVLVTLVGVIAWVLKSAVPTLAKQYRDDVFGLQKDYKDALATLAGKFDLALDKLGERHERELQKRDVALEKLTTCVDKLAERVEHLESARSQKG